jgi:VanZ family protein
LVYALMIFVFAQSAASGATPMIAKLREWFPSFSYDQAAAVVLYLRRLIHLGSYFLALVLVYSAVTATPLLNHFPYSVSVLLALILAACDEWYQTRLPHRSGSAADVLLDLIGIFLAVGTIRLFSSIRNKNEKASSN